jgi:DNA-binding transcriptional regulator YiaG
MRFRRTLQAWRKREGLSQSQAAKAIGIPIDTLQNWEQGRYEPKGTFLRQALLDRMKSISKK